MGSGSNGGCQDMNNGISRLTRGSQREFFEVYPYPAKNCGVAVPSRNWKEVADYPIFTSTTISRSILIKPHGTNIISAAKAQLPPPLGTNLTMTLTKDVPLYRCHLPKAIDSPSPLKRG